MLTLVVALVSGCSRSDDAEDTSAVGHAVGTRLETLIDTTRPTDALGDAPGKPSRTLETLVYYPAEGRSGGDPVRDAPAAATGRPFPLIVFSHGSGVSDPARYDLLLRAWAAAGYVIAAPRFPLSSTSRPGGGSDVVNQPGDVSFVITEMARRGGDPTAPYGGLVDAGRVAVAGHSLGGVTTMGVAFNGCCVDRRIGAAVVLAGAAAAFPGDRWFEGIRAPLLVVHGDDDRVVRIAEGRQLFHDAPEPKAMLTLLGGDHNRPYGGSLATTDNPDRLGATVNGPTRIVNTTVVAFLDRYLKDRTDALAHVSETLAEEVGVSFEVVGT